MAFGSGPKGCMERIKGWSVLGKDPGGIERVKGGEGKIRRGEIFPSLSLSLFALGGLGGLDTSSTLKHSNQRARNNQRATGPEDHCYFYQVIFEVYSIQTLSVTIMLLSSILCSTTVFCFSTFLD